MVHVHPSTRVCAHKFIHLSCVVGVTSCETESQSPCVSFCVFVLLCIHHYMWLCGQQPMWPKQTAKIKQMKNYSNLSLSLPLCSLHRYLILFSRMGCGWVSTPWTSWVWAMFGYVCLSWSRNPVSSNSTTTSTCALSSSSCSTPVSPWPCAPVFFTAILCCIYCNNSLNK